MLSNRVFLYFFLRSVLPCPSKFTFLLCSCSVCSSLFFNGLISYPKNSLPGGSRSGCGPLRLFALFCTMPGIGTPPPAFDIGVLVPELGVGVAVNECVSTQGLAHTSSMSMSSSVSSHPLSCSSSSTSGHLPAVPLPFFATNLCPAPEKCEVAFACPFAA